MPISRFPKKSEAEIYHFAHGFDSVDGKFPATVVAKFDYFTAMYYGCKITDVLDYFGLSSYFTYDLFTCFSDRFKMRNNTGDNLKVNLAPGIAIEINWKVLAQQKKLWDFMELSYEDFCNTEWQSFRLALTGTGLEYLRSLNYPVDQRLSMPSYVVDLNGKYYANAPGDGRCRITRLDVAFDFLNYQEDLFTSCVEMCKKYDHDDTGRVFTGILPQLKTSRAWSARTGHERTLYLGTGGSDKLSRMYDKLFQWNQQKSADINKFPYKTKEGIIPTSWIRIECQLRDEACDELLFSANGDFTKMLNWYYSYFAICSEKNKVVPEYDMFFDWSSLPHIIQNLHLAIVPKSKSDRVRDSYSRILKPFAEIISHDGIEVAVNTLLSLLTDIQLNDDPLSLRRFTSIKERCLLDDNSLPRFMWRDNTGIWRFGSIPNEE